MSLPAHRAITNPCTPNGYTYNTHTLSKNNVGYMRPYYSLIPTHLEKELP